MLRTIYTNWCRNQDTFASYLICRFYIDIMPPNQKFMEKMKLELCQTSTSFTTIYNNTFSLFDKYVFSYEDITRLTSSIATLESQLKECNDLEKQLRDLVIKEMDNENEINSLFDEDN